MKMLNEDNLIDRDRADALGGKPTIALLPWGDVWDDFLDSIGVSLETFCADGFGGWLLGYLQSLQSAGVRTILILISARVTAPLRFRHAATGATITVLPTTQSYLAIRRQAIDPNPYSAKSFEEMYGNVRGLRRRWLKLLDLLSPYLATPLGLLAAELRREDCRAILCQDYESPRFDACVLLGKLMGLPVLASFQSGCYDPNRIGRWLRPLTVQACAGTIVGPQTEIHRIRDRYNLPAAKIAQIFNPIDLQVWQAIDRAEARSSLGLPLDAQIVVWHGRIEMNTKRVDILIDAWEQICRDRGDRDLRLLLLGTGQDAEILREQIAALPLQNVMWIDRYATDRLEIRRVLSAGDVYAFPSVFEGFPVAPIEAMACGLPLVAAAASGVPDILQDGEASGGLLVPCNDVAAFTAALSRILDDPAWGRELGILARHRVETAFSIAAVGDRFLNFFLERQILLENTSDRVE
jgi:glycosyltransferase involved in cell wall biosynthesis